MQAWRNCAQSRFPLRNLFSSATTVGSIYALPRAFRRCRQLACGGRMIWADAFRLLWFSWKSVTALETVSAPRRRFLLKREREGIFYRVQTCRFMHLSHTLPFAISVGFSTASSWWETKYGGTAGCYLCQGSLLLVSIMLLCLFKFPGYQSHFIFAWVVTVSGWSTRYGSLGGFLTCFRYSDATYLRMAWILARPLLYWHCRAYRTLMAWRANETEYPPRQIVQSSLNPFLWLGEKIYAYCWPLSSI